MKKIIFVLTLMCSQALAQTWTELGPNHLPANATVFAGFGRTACIRFHPQYNGTTNQTVFVSGASGGLWKSTTGGNNWTVMNTDNLPNICVSDLAINPTTPNTMYLATGDPDTPFNCNLPCGENEATQSIGVYKTTNGGTSWTGPIGTWNSDPNFWSYPSEKIISKMLINPNNPNILLVTTYEKYWDDINDVCLNDGYVYRSTDAGITWTQTLFVQDGYFRDIEFKPGDPNTIYVSGKYFYKSTDGGANFTSMSGFPAASTILRSAIAVSVANANAVYFQVTNNNTEDHNFYYSSNSGANNTLVNTITNLNSENVKYRLGLDVDPTNINNLMYGSFSVRKSTNGALTFPTTISNIHFDIHNIVYEPITSSPRIFVAHDGGISTIAYTGTSGTDISDGLGITQFFRLGVAEKKDKRLYAGAQDNGGNLRDPDLFANGWGFRQGGDGNESLIDYTNSDIIYHTDNQTAQNLFYRSTNAGASGSWTSIAVPGQLGGENRPVVIDPITPTTMYAGYNDLWKSTTIGTTNTWNQISNLGITAHKMVAISVHPINPQVIYVAFPYITWGGTLEKKLYRTADGGVNWFDRTAGLTGVYYQSITSIAVDPLNENIIYVAFNGCGNAKVMKSTNGGVNWSDINTGFASDVGVNYLIAQKNSNQRVYAATDKGVYYTEGGTGTWQLYGTGLPNVKVNDLEINYCSKKLKIATYGRGVWETTIPDNSFSDIVINTNTVWNTSKRISGNVIIEPNVTLTIQSGAIINMSTNSLITIKRGAKLIVDGATLTNDCGFMWQGILVEGNSNASQYTTGAQGWLEIKNGALIENAKEVARTKRINADGSTDYNYTGGIIQAMNSTFRNNRRCAEFLTFHNPSDVANRSFFSECTFETTAQLKDPTVVPSAFISMWDVKGVQILGNIFRCNTTSGYTGVNRGKGVSTLDAVYNIERTITLVGNQFINLNMGAEQGSSAPVSTGINYITGNSFDDNTYGVYISGTGIPSYVNENNFFRPSPAITSPASYGFYSTSSKGLTISCNIFSYLTYANNISHSGATSDPASLINNNNFNENYRGIQTQNSNANLQIKYNNFTKSNVTQVHWLNQGPIPHQGFCSSQTSPSGNQFLGSAPMAYKDIRNTSSTSAFNYNHHSSPLADVLPEIYFNLYVTPIQCTPAWAANEICEGGGAGLMAGGGASQQESYFTEDAFNAYQSDQLYGEDAVIDEINDYIHSAGLDTNPTAAIEYLEHLDYEQANWFLVPYYITQENYNAAVEVLANLEAGDLNQAIKLNYFHTIIDAGLEGRNLSQFDSIEVAELDVIAAGSSDVRDNARSILQFFYGRTYPVEEINLTDIPIYFEEPTLEGELVIPNIITPNGDGSNDVFVIENLPGHSSLSIFSNNGTQVYYSDSYANDWPPTTIPAGRYYFSLILPDGTEQNSYFDVVY